MRNWIHLCARGLEPYEYSIPQFAARAYTFNLPRSVKEYSVVQKHNAAIQLESSVCVYVASHFVPPFDNAVSGADKQLRSISNPLRHSSSNISRLDIASIRGWEANLLLIKRHIVRKQPLRRSSYRRGCAPCVPIRYDWNLFEWHAAEFLMVCCHAYREVSHYTD